MEKKKEIKPNISDSRMRMHIRCGEQDRFRYEMGIKIPPGVAQIVGIGTHTVANLNLNNKKDKGALLSESEVTDAARDQVKGLWQQGVTLVGDEKTVGAKKLKGQATDDSVRLSRLHHLEVAPNIEPVSVERYFKIELKDQPMDLAGRMDVETINGIRDLKTSAKTPNVQDVRLDDQITIYALAKKVETGKIPNDLQMDYLVKTKQEKYVPMPTERTQENLDRVVRLLDFTIQDIKAGHFAPNPNGWHCSRRYCGYWSRCKFFSGRD